MIFKTLGDEEATDLLHSNMLEKIPKRKGKEIIMIKENVNQ